MHSVRNLYREGLIAQLENVHMKATKLEVLVLSMVLASKRGTGIRGLMRGTATLPQGNQELSVVRDKVGRPQVSLE